MSIAKGLISRFPSNALEPEFHQAGKSPIASHQDILHFGTAATGDPCNPMVTPQLRLGTSRHCHNPTSALYFSFFPSRPPHHFLRRCPSDCADSSSTFRRLSDFAIEPSSLDHRVPAPTSLHRGADLSPNHGVAAIHNERGHLGLPEGIQTS